MSVGACILVLQVMTSILRLIENLLTALPEVLELCPHLLKTETQPIYMQSLAHM